MTTKAATTQPRLSVTLSPGQSLGDLLTDTQTPSSMLAEEHAAFPVSAIAHEEHPRTNAWAGLAEAGQILAEAEAHMGRALTQAELRTVLDAHLDTYDPTWNFGRAGISDAWIAGFCHTFALYAQAVARQRHQEPIAGIGLVGCPEAAPSPRCATDQPRTPVQFRHATILVADPDAFWQGIWEGQLAALDAQPAWQTPGMVIPPLTSAGLCDELLDLVVELGNHGLDFVTGYVLGESEGLLCGRTTPPARRQVECAFVSAGSGGNS